jgi:hypothetical protein
MNNLNDIEKALDLMNSYFTEVKTIKKAILDSNEFKPQFEFKIDRNERLSIEKIRQLKLLSDMHTEIQKIEMHFEAILRILNRRGYKYERELEIRKLFKVIE